MSPCIHVDLGNGVIALAKVSGHKPALCSFCRRREHSKLCDFPTGKSGATCDRKMCDQCATSVGGNRDYCPKHSGQGVLPLQEAK